MATTTPNFGWSVPTSTDLVKDGATAIETLGDSIDASLVDLKGGTTGQVLKKNSGTDMDFVWGTDSAGMTNPMTTTGDTIYSSSGSTPARLGIGTAGQVLQVNSGATAPEWVTGSSSSFTQLATGTLSGASVSLTSISGSYQDLILVITKFRPATDGANLWLRMNNVTAANYASSTSGAGGSSGTAGANQVTLTNQQDDTANSYSLMVFRFPQYANAITWKYLVGESVTNNSGDPLDINFSRPIGILSQTTAAITQIDLLSSSGNLTSGTYTLYGVK